MSYFDIENIKNSLNTELKNFLLLMSLHEFQHETPGTISQNKLFQEVCGNDLTVDVEATNQKIDLKVTQNNEIYVQFTATYRDEEMDWLINDEFVMANTVFDKIESWRAFEALGELTSLLEQELIISLAEV